VAGLVSVVIGNGFRSIRITDHFERFGDTAIERVARRYGISAVNAHAVRP